MSPVEEGADVPPEHSILRLPIPRPDFEPDEYLPSGDFFVLSTAERNGNGQLSVWDETLTTVAQARELRGGSDVLILRGKCGAIVAAGVSCSKRISVVYEAPPSAIAGRPGAQGHAGIAGLRRSKGEHRNDYRDLRNAIAGCFEFVP